LQGLAVGAVARLDRHAVQHRGVERRQLPQIQPGCELALLGGPLQPRQDAGLHVAPVVRQKGARAFARPRAGQCAQHHQASRRQAGRGEAFGRRGQHALDGLPRSRRIEQGAPRRAAFRLAVKRHGLAEELFLGSERAIQTGRVDAHRGRQIGQRCAVISLGPEDLHGLAQGLGPVEIAGAPTFCHGAIVPRLARHFYRSLKNDLTFRRASRHQICIH